MIVAPDVIERVAPTLNIQDFFVARHGWIYAAIVALYEHGDAIDAATVGDKLRRLGKLEEAGDLPYIYDLTIETPTALHAETYAKELRSLAVRRQLINAAALVAAAAYDEKANLSNALEVARNVFVVQESRATDNFKLLSSDHILTTAWPSPVWAIPDLLPTGLTILAGRPKLGKSWLALQIAQAIAVGGYALGERVERGPILYLALEDSPARLKDRMLRQGWPTGLPAHFMPIGQFENSVGDLRNGGGHRLAAQIERECYRLVVIDTLSRSCQGDQNDVQAMTRALTPLQQIAHDKNCAILLVDHHRKMAGFESDAVGDILGSTGKGAVCDTAWGLYRERGKAGAKLSITGRDVEEKNLALYMDWQTGAWQLEGDADQIAMTERRQEILDTLDLLNKATVGDIAKEIGQDKGNTFRRLQDMVSAGVIVKEKVGSGVFYSQPPNTVQ
uniref:Putative ATPase domain containing protein n=1 Tax=viral metagenome TaxID=1070528 RepID=A0A6M3K521_9ZZZZ